MIRKWLCRLSMPISILSVFIYLIVRYTEIRVIEETTRSLPIPILALIIVFATIVGVGGAVLAIGLWWTEIKNDPISIKLFAPISVLMISVTFIFRLILNKAEALILLNVDRLLEDMTNYSASTMIIIAILGGGLIIGIIGAMYEKAQA